MMSGKNTGQGVEQMAYEIRKATEQDIDAVAEIYEKIHSAEEQGGQTIGWIRGVYPVRRTAEDAWKRDDLYVLTDGGAVLGAAIINQAQVDVYAKGNWAHASDRVCVLHTLVIDPDAAGRGYGRDFVAFYEKLALNMGCRELRLDTNAKNAAARKLYRGLGYQEIGIVPTVFNGIPGVDLVLLEKYLPE